MRPSPERTLSAVQSIVTLNVTNTSTLDLLLAGLMENTTGGWDAVNGTLQSVTDGVGFLGLGEATDRALPNATEPSDGLWGPPTSEAPHRPTSSLIGEFWNAVTSFVTNPLGTVLSLAYTVWDAAEAAVVYLDHLGTEAAALGAAIKARTAAAIVQVGHIIGSALDQLINYLVELVSEALSPVVSPMVHDAESFDSESAAAGNRTVLDVQHNGTVSLADGLSWANSFDSISLIGDVLGAVVVIALTVLLPVGLGAGTLVSILLRLLPEFVQDVFPSGAGSITALTSEAVLDFGAYFSSISTTVWEAIAGAVAIGASSLDILFANIAVAAKGGGAATGWAGFAILTSLIVDTLVVAITIVNWAPSLQIMQATALVLGGIGLAIALLLHGSVLSQLGAYADVALVLASVAAGAAIADYLLHNG